MNQTLPAIVLSAELALPEFADGRRGSNRCEVAGQLGDVDDFAAISAWLAQPMAEATRASYLREVRRLLKWSLEVARKPLSGLSYPDLQAYAAFLAAPPASWIGSAKVPPQDPRWRPLAGPLGASSRRQAMLALNNFFAWLERAGYLRANPLALAKVHRRSGVRVARPRRYLALPQWQELLRTVEALPAGPRQARDRWLLSILWFGLRISEVANATMGAVEQLQDDDGELRWYLRVVGKGNKERLVPVTDELLAELARYRQSLGLPPHPVAHEPLPLIVSLRNTAPLSPASMAPPLSRACLHNAFKQIAADAAARVRAAGEEARAALLEQASAHWIRHSSGSALINASGVKATTVRDVLGHENLATTNIYLHAEDRERHQALSASHRIGWSAMPEIAPANDR
jgi:site-specific recombinase XerD